MAIDIPVTVGNPDQSMRITLDGNPYNVRIYWSQYDDCMRETMGDIDGMWYMDLVGQNFTIRAIALVGGADLFEIYGYRELGSLFVADTSGAADDATFDGLGDRWKLRYYDTTENEEFLRSIGYR
ncbi:MAG: phage baseplate plug family protein [Plesiomonas shigelloides]